MPHLVVGGHILHGTEAECTAGSKAIRVQLEPAMEKDETNGGKVEREKSTSSPTRPDRRRNLNSILRINRILMRCFIGMRRFSWKLAESH